MAPTRRRTLAAVAGLASLGTVAGCSGDAGDEAGNGDEADGPTAEASFFVFGAVAEAVAGDAATANLLVPIGQHGHGWEPGPRVRTAIRDADLFVHGMEGFQPWVDDVLRDLAADDADVVTVDASAGIDLLPAGDGHDHATDEHDGETQADSGEHDGETEADGDEHDEENGAPTDPHFWMDPLRVVEAAENVRDGLGDVDPDGAAAYEDNAGAYVEDLEALHDTLESTVEDGSTNTILVAGHDAMGYLGDRYGVEVHALTNVSPDDRPTPRDVQRAQEVIDEHGLEYVCADPLESQQAAEQLVAETDAREVLPLTAMPGVTEEWEAEGWGYLDVMENVNLPTLERVLDA